MNEWHRYPLDKCNQGAKKTALSSKVKKTKVLICSTLWSRDCLFQDVCRVLSTTGTLI